MYRLSDLISPDELYHHGIKGQKWGRRRFQNEDGSLTPAGKERYDDGPNNPSRPKHRDKLIAKYQSEGLSKENAQYMADRRIKAEKIVLAVGTTTVVAATAYVAHKKLKGKIDKVIKEGAEIQRISTNTRMDRALYVAFDKNDMIKYRGMYGQEMGLAKDRDLKNITLKATGKIKIPSRKKAEDTFANLYKNDPEFKKSLINNFTKMQKDYWFQDPDMEEAVDDFLDMVKKGSGKAASKFADVERHTQNKEFDKLLPRLYDAFNFGLVNTRDDGKVVGNKFYAKLKEMGYDAVTDINDQKYSGYKTKNPTIVFNTGKLAIEKVKDLTLTEISSDYKNSQAILKNQIKTEKLIKELQANSKTYGGMAAMVGGASASLGVANTVMINKYRREHPNTRLSDKEILKMLQAAKINNK